MVERSNVRKRTSKSGVIGSHELSLSGLLVASIAHPILDAIERSDERRKG